MWALPKDGRHFNARDQHRMESNMHAAFQPPQKQARSTLAAAQSSALGRQLFFVLSQVEREFRTQMQVALEPLDLDVRQYTTLAYLAGGQTPTQLELSHILHLDPSQVVTLTKGLATRGLLTRQTVPEDRRARALLITPEGKALYQQGAIVVQRVEDAITASLSRRDRSALKNLLDRTLPLS